MSTTQNDGNLVLYLAALPVVAAACGQRLVVMASLQELQVLTVQGPGDEAPPMTAALEADPTFVAAGPQHVAAGINSLVGAPLVCAGFRAVPKCP